MDIKTYIDEKGVKYTHESLLKGIKNHIEFNYLGGDGGSSGFINTSGVPVSTWDELGEKYPWPLKNHNNAKYIAQCLMENGFSKCAAAGIIGCMNKESGLDPAAINKDGGAKGLCQWFKSNRTKMEAWCSKNGYSSTSLEGQCKYTVYWVKSYSSKFERINSCQTPQEAAVWFNATFEMGTYSSPEAAMNAWNSSSTIKSHNGGEGAGSITMGRAVSGAKQAYAII